MLYFPKSSSWVQKCLNPHVFAVDQNWYWSLIPLNIVKRIYVHLISLLGLHSDHMASIDQSECRILDGIILWNIVFDHGLVETFGKDYDLLSIVYFCFVVLRRLSKVFLLNKMDFLRKFDKNVQRFWMQYQEMILLSGSDNKGVEEMDHRILYKSSTYQ